MNKSWLAFLMLSVMWVSCRKNPGQGGSAEIRGRVWVRQYDEVMGTLNYSYWAKDQNVFIVYGDEVGYSDKTSTDYEGYFSFPYLRPGSYTVYMYSTDSTKILGPPINVTAPDSAVVMQAEVTKSHQLLDLGVITILKNK